MVGISNSSSYAALRALQSYSSQIETAQNRIATGYKISSAADNASIWNIAQSLRSDISSTEATQTNLTSAITKIKVANTAISTVQSIMGQMKTQLANAVGATTTTKTSIQTTITSLQAQLKTVINSATVDGVNLLKDGSLQVVTGYNPGVGTTTDTTTVTALMNTAGTTGTLGVETGTSGAFAAGVASGSSILNFSIATGADSNPDAEIAVLQTELNTAITAIETAATSIAASQNRLTSQSDFLKTINQVKTTALGNLVDADLNEESVKLTALQTKQQLAVSALQIANSSDSYILRLFQ